MTKVESSSTPMTEKEREEWLQFIERTAGKWVGEFERPEQGEYEERDWWP